MPTADEARLLAHLLRYCRGRDSGRSNAVLAAELGLGERRLRQLVDRLVEEDGYLIGTHPQFGVFTIQSEADYVVARTCLEQHVWPLMRRMEALKASWAAAQTAPRSEVWVQPGLFSQTGG